MCCMFCCSIVGFLVEGVDYEPFPTLYNPSGTAYGVSYLYIILGLDHLVGAEYLSLTLSLGITRCLRDFCFSYPVLEIGSRKITAYNTCVFS